MNKLKINLYGETFIIQKIDVPETQKVHWESIANKLNKKNTSSADNPPMTGVPVDGQKRGSRPSISNEI